ncbi:MAG: MFS transporter [Eubacteriales bacterium]|nr:MFS transporter [Eubacteriales bacterium]
MMQPTKTKLGASNWIAIVLLAFSGQIAWVVENVWFNTFVNDVISPDPKVISMMVAFSAITATLTTLVMGTLSDRLGKRKAIILISYILWGISTIIFPIAGAIRSATAAIAAVIALDCLMTFFGSTANDASFNAWLTNVTDETNRGTVSGVTELFPLLAMVVTTIVSGVLIERVGYTLFFVFMGLLVVLCGLVGGLLMKEAVFQREKTEGIGFWKQVFSGFSIRAVRENRMLFALYFCVLVFSIAEQISTPYEIIYFTKTLGYSYDVIGVNLGLMVLLAGVAGVFFGRLVDRWGKQRLMLVALVLSAIGFLLVSFARSMGFLCVAIFVMAFGLVSKLIVSGAWIKDLTPPSMAGQFQGVRMVFWVLLPMVIGPFIGERLIRFFGQPIVVDGKSGFLPTHLIFIASALVTLLAILPVLRMIRSTTNPAHPASSDTTEIASSNR